MSSHALSWAWRADVPDVECKVILVKLADQANDDGECWPSLRTICSETGIGRTTAWDRITKLRDDGLLEVEERVRADGGRSSNLYRLALAPPSVQADGGSPARRMAPVRAGEQHEPPFEPSSLLKERARAEDWNPIYDALVLECYPAGAVLTRAEQGRVVKAAKNIASAGATADMVAMVRAAYQAHTSYSRCTLTAMALSNRWAELAPTVRAGERCDECGLSAGRHLADCSRAVAA